MQYSLCNDYNELIDFRVMPDAIYTCAYEINLSLIIVLVDKKIRYTKSYSSIREFDHVQERATNLSSGDFLQLQTEVPSPTDLTSV